MSNQAMDWTERQEYYDLIEEEIKFAPQKGQKWILSFEERHTFGHDILFHVYTEKGESMLQVYEIVDVMALEVKSRLHKLNETLSGNLRIYMSTLRADLPHDMAWDENAKDGSRFKFSFAKRDKVETYEWDLPTGNFKRIQPVLKLIWAVDGWWQGSKAMGWSASESKERKKPDPDDRNNSESSRPEKGGKRGRIDPFGNVW